MKICIPTADDRGLEAAPTGHPGGAPYYTLVDTETGKIRTVQRGGHGAARGVGECGSGATLRALGVQTIVCRDVGRRAMASLEAAGVTVMVSDGRTVAEILAAAREGRLRTLTADEVCAGHGARHGGCGEGRRQRSHRHHRERPEAAKP
jgi:predicted Fe-Mo cluster-binding NifX family protein